MLKGKLYDQGFTSLGNKKNTAPNPSLLASTDPDSGMKTYLPAYMLADGQLERANRSVVGSASTIVVNSTEISH